MRNLHDLLHSPTEPLLSSEEHMYKAARLSRALWLLIDNTELDTRDERDRCALKELASELAHHASAAIAAMERKTPAAA